MSLRSRFGRLGDPAHADVGQYLNTLRRSPVDPSVVAYFDLDHTLIAGYSATALVLERVRGGSLHRMLASLGALLGYGIGRTDYYALLSAFVRDLTGESERALRELGERAFQRRIQSWIYPQARTLIDIHRRLGHHIVIVTSATRFQSAPVARELAVDALLCTELEVVSDLVSGKVQQFCFGPGKLSAAEVVAHRRQTDLDRAYFYSDSADDLPLLEAVRHPVVVNPRAAMARLARTRGWPCLMFDPAREVGVAAA